jgi:hypothetical protein
LRSAGDRFRSRTQFSLLDGHGAEGRGHTRMAPELKGSWKPEQHGPQRLAALITKVLFVFHIHHTRVRKTACAEKPGYQRITMMHWSTRSQQTSGFQRQRSTNINANWRNPRKAQDSLEGWRAHIWKKLLSWTAGAAPASILRHRNQGTGRVKAAPNPVPEWQAIRDAICGTAGKSSSCWPAPGFFFPPGRTLRAGR